MRNIYFVVSCLYDDKSGVGGVSTLVHELANKLSENSNYYVEVISLFGLPFPNTAKYNLKILQNSIKHSQNLSLFSKIIFWIYCISLLLHYILICTYRKENKTIISCNPGASFLSILFGKNYIIWENVAFLAKHKIFDFIKLKIINLRKSILIVSSEQEYEFLLQNFFLKNRNLLCHINNWIDDSLTTKNNLISTPKITINSNIKFISAGMLEKRKGFDILINSVKLLPKEILDKTLFDIYGVGEEFDNLLHSIDNLKLKNNISLKGYSENLYTNYQFYDCFILSSRYEGTPLVLINALAFGLPCIVTDCPTGPDKLICDQYPELVAISESPESLAHCILHFFKNHNYYKLNQPIDIKYSVKPYLFINCFEKWKHLLEKNKY